MNLNKFLDELKAQEIELVLDGDKLRCRGPKEILTPDLLAKVTQYKVELMTLLRERLDAPETYPLSQGQRALWFLYKLAPDSAAYNIMYSARLQSDLNIEALRQAFTQLIERHSILRTTYTTLNDEPIQQVHKKPLIHFKVIEGRHWSQEDLNNWISKEADRPFDLEQGPVLRIELTEFSESAYPILLLTVHHIAMDFWSFDIFNNELEIFYNAIHSGELVDLPPLQWNYKNYVSWETEMLASGKGKHLLTYWQKQLDGELPVLNLPTDYPRPRIQTYNGTNYDFELDEKTTQQLRDFSQETGNTSYMILLAVFQVLLSRYTAQEDILIGSPMLGRNRSELENMLGYFVNPVVLRTQLHGNPTFKQWLDNVRHLVLEALEHQDYPFGLLVEQLQIERDSSRSPLFQVAFAWDRPRSNQLALSGNNGEQSERLIIETLATGQRGSAFDLTLTVYESERFFNCQLTYNTDLFEQATISRMAGHLQTLVTGILTNPHQRLSKLPLLTQTEYQQFLAWNDTKVDYPQDKCIHQLFESQVAKTPDAIAVVFENQQLTYSVLNRRANQLAHYLQTLGVKPEVLVGICVERSLEMIIGLLGILKAGGAYVPLDPSYPKERLAFMLEDAQVPVLLTQNKLIEQLSEHQAQVVCLDTDWETISQWSEEDLVSGVQAENLAYVIYTSGSTGKPKGVQIVHQSLTNFLITMQESPGLTERDILLAVTTISFDIAALELYLPLIVGAQITLISRQMASDGVQLLETLDNSNITIMQATPATWRLLLASGWEKTPHLKVLVGGEALPKKLAKQLLEKSASVWNLYGPTETTIWSATYQAKIDSLVNQVLDTSESIGCPIANTQIYILDRYLQPTPIGVPGELHIGGAGLARGYLNRLELTKEKFIPNPFSDEPNACLYKTGDLARYLPDGNIEYLGRIDNQVKIRGFRIELGEIEAILSQHPTVQEGVVIVQEETSGDKRLIAYLVSTQEQVNIGELRSFLKEKLPYYMIPSAFVSLETMPLTPNGKIDRRALTQLSVSGEQLSTEKFVAPATSEEEQLAKIWAEVLGVEQVGINDNFFDLGGHSLLIVQAQAKLQQLVTKDISIVELFEYPTIHTLVQHLFPSKKVPSSNSQLKQEKNQLHSKKLSNDIAIIGMAAHFPGATDIETFWQNLREGVESITFFEEAELLSAGVNAATLNKPNYVKANAILADIEKFDAEFFDFNPREAETTDPQHRLFLECAWEAIENAGYDVETDEHAIGVYAGVGMNTYLLNNIAPNHDLSDPMENYQLMIGNGNDFLSTRVSYKLNLKGPSIDIQTACSTSLVAVHLACKALLNNECNMILAGGVSIRVPHKTGYLYQEGMILSPDGHCRAFDAKAQGTVGSNGVGIVILKKLTDAITDGDSIHAVIKGSAINNDGSVKVGYTAPSIEGQTAVITAAQAVAGIESETISYVETHGTGTVLGDPIEITALNKAFQATTQKKSFCALGSVKTNIGHTDTAAGVAGLIKTVLALKHQLLPPSLHFEQPNPQIDFANSPFYVNTELSEWKTDNNLRRAGVSSFGIGGTNAHVILEEAPLSEKLKVKSEKCWQLLVLSAKTATALDKASANLATYLEQHADINFADVAYTLSIGRKAFNHRRVLVVQKVDDAITALTSLDPTRVFSSFQEPKSRTVCFMFSGQGAQYVNMSLELYQHEPIFKETVDFCAEYLQPILELDLREILYPKLTGEQALEKATQQLNQTSITQPALFVIEYALAKLWMEWGVYPAAMIGHSIGEYVAACLAEVFSLEDALSLVAMRGKMMQDMPHGTMLGISLSEQDLQSFLHDGVSLAAVNGSIRCVVSGSPEAMETLQNQLAENGVDCRPLHTSHAFHSAMMEPILEPFTKQIKKVKLNPPKIPYVSNLTGTWITEAEAINPDYYAQHLRQTVRFADGLQNLLEESGQILLEIGPGQTLATLTKQHPNKVSAQAILPSLRHPQTNQSDMAFLLNSLGKFWLAGGSISWAKFYANERRYRIPLPTYPFERQRYWIEPPKHDSHAYQSVSLEISDKANLSESTHQRPQINSVYVAPHNELEEKLADILQIFLGIEQVGIYDDFFELGGDSLLATRVISMVREVCEVELPIQILFEQPNVARLAESIEAFMATEQQDTLDSEEEIGRL